jgi:hypothetical protein
MGRLGLLHGLSVLFFGEADDGRGRVEAVLARRRGGLVGLLGLCVDLLEVLEGHLAGRPVLPVLRVADHEDPLEVDRGHLLELEAVEDDVEAVLRFPLVAVVDRLGAAPDAHEGGATVAQGDRELDPLVLGDALRVRQHDALLVDAGREVVGELGDVFEGGGNADLIGHGCPGLRGCRGAYTRAFGG